jgi:hypothetical protein
MLLLNRRSLRPAVETGASSTIPEPINSLPSTGEFQKRASGCWLLIFSSVTGLNNYSRSAVPGGDTRTVITFSLAERPAWPKCLLTNIIGIKLKLFPARFRYLAMDSHCSRLLFVACSYLHQPDSTIFVELLFSRTLPGYQVCCSGISVQLTFAFYNFVTFVRCFLNLQCIMRNLLWFLRLTILIWLLRRCEWALL